MEACPLLLGLAPDRLEKSPGKVLRPGHAMLRPLLRLGRQRSGREMIRLDGVAEFDQIQQRQFASPDQASQVRIAEDGNRKALIASVDARYGVKIAAISQPQIDIIVAKIIPIKLQDDIVRMKSGYVLPHLYKI